MAKIGATDLEVFPLCLGGNVFGWTADLAQSFAVLDAYAAAGGNFIDTADVYSVWAKGHVGGESENIIGRWMASRGNRARMVIATKVGLLQVPVDRSVNTIDLSPKTIVAALEASLRRLRTDHIDLYYAHRDDEGTPLSETLGAFDALVREGKVRHIAASNYTAKRLGEALAVSKSDGSARYVALQPHYNLVHRGEYEGSLAALCARERLACIPYYGLAKGFLSGKYRPGVVVASEREKGARAYLDERGGHVLAALDEISRAHRTTVAAVALAWLRAQPTVTSPIASARTPEQLLELLPMATLQLEERELDSLGRAAAPIPSLDA